MRALVIEAWARRYDFQRMSVKGNIIRGHYRLTDNTWSTTILAHLSDMDIFETRSGCRQVRHCGHVVYTFGLVKGA